MNDEKKVACDRAGLGAGQPVQTGASWRFELGPPLGVLHVFVRCARGYEPIPGEKYRISGPHGVDLQGKTSKTGEIQHEDPKTPIDHYDLEVCGGTFKVDARDPALGPLVVRVPDWPPEKPLEGPPVEQTEGKAPPTFDVLILGNDHRPLPGAAWNAQGTTPASGTADANGLARLQADASAERVEISWQTPEGTKHSAKFWTRFPDDRQTAARRRLDNLGFTRGPTLEKDIAAFQAKFGWPRTGKLDDVIEELGHLHDRGVHPVDGA